jgi:lysine-ketoglutarate reductase/saccharopine dehydrogenase-like protein (TIGR00300 family)
MSHTRPHAAVVAAEGHLIDSQILTAIFDTVIERGAAFEVLHFDIGRTNDEFSRLTLRISAETAPQLARVVEELIPLGCHQVEEQDAITRIAEVDGAVADDFYSTTNQRTHVRVDGRWLEAEQQRMDAVIVVAGGRAVCRKLRDVKAGDRVVCGVGGIRVSPEFRDRERSDFSFMSNEVSSERRVEASVARIARMMQAIRQRGGRIVFVAGPVVVHTGGAPYFVELIRRGYVDILLAGNALAVHDAELALFGTSLGVDLEAGAPVHGGHRHHMRAINAINRAGGIRGAVNAGVLTSGVMVECVRAGVPYVLAGSVRDDGPIADTVTDIVAAQDRYAEALIGAGIVIVLSTMLHGIGTCCRRGCRSSASTSTPPWSRNSPIVAHPKPSAWSQTSACSCTSSRGT